MEPPPSNRAASLATSREPAPEQGPLRLTSVTHGYGQRRVLHRVDLTVAAGECVALLGPNGCGKSTLLRLAAGRETPDTGEVTYGGAAVSEDDYATRARIATALDSGAATYPDLTVREHLLLVGLAHGLAEEADTRADEVLGAHRLAGHTRALAGELSSGLRQLMALAVTEIRPYELLVLDEPEQHLDSTARAELGGRITAATDRGAAVLMATHDPGLATATGARVLRLDGGVLDDSAGDDVGRNDVGPNDSAQDGSARDDSARNHSAPDDDGAPEDGTRDDGPARS